MLFVKSWIRKENFNWLVQNCWICQSPTISSCQLCRFCLSQIQVPRLQSRSNSSSYFAAHRYLWEWKEPNSWIKPFLYSQKHQPQMWIHNWLAQLFLLNENFSFQNSPQKWLFVPCPGKMGRKYNHAESLARALNETFGMNFMEIFMPLPRTEQKLKSKRERQNITLNVKECVRISDLLNDYQKIVFVDDLLTSGATSQMAWKALAKSQKFEVWTLFYRPPSQSLMNLGPFMSHQLASLTTP